MVQTTRHEGHVSSQFISHEVIDYADLKLFKQPPTMIHPVTTNEGVHHGQNTYPYWLHNASCTQLTNIYNGTVGEATISILYALLTYYILFASYRTLF